MIATITADNRDPDALLVHAGPELANTMGAFSPARFNRDRRAYLLAASYLDTFLRWARQAGITVVDDRSRDPQPATWVPTRRGGVPSNAEFRTALAALKARNRGAEPDPADGWDDW